MDTNNYSNTSEVKVNNQKICHHMLARSCYNCFSLLKTKYKISRVKTNKKSKKQLRKKTQLKSSSVSSILIL